MKAEEQIEILLIEKDKTKHESPTDMAPVMQNVTYFLELRIYRK